ncbi:hypothetical protein Q7C36_002421 [Tachysurus vachellii]|uniref:Uncharacterized protein n=1 Tax=Tachysurus vachellii TaxID=175792 RepID=A0AA88NYW9_TACVA|nr:hypothetical protein Q7C36_002421 [Tachysurus vachellii]
MHQNRKKSIIKFSTLLPAQHIIHSSLEDERTRHWQATNIVCLLSLIWKRVFDIIDYGIVALQIRRLPGT